MCVCVCVQCTSLNILFNSTERLGVMKDAEYVCHFRFSEPITEALVSKYLYRTDFREQWPSRYGD